MANKVSDRMISYENLNLGYAEVAQKAAKFAYDMKMAFNLPQMGMTVTPAEAKKSALNAAIRELTHAITTDLTGREATKEQKQALAQVIVRIATEQVATL